VQEKWLDSAPDLPRIKVAHKPRSALSLDQYRHLLRSAKSLHRRGVVAPSLKTSEGRRSRFWITPRYRTLPLDMYALIIFMVNSFVRPSDIKNLRHRHVEVVRTHHAYLRLTLPESKRHDKPIVSLQPAVRVYGHLRQHWQEKGLAKPDDWVFLPQEKDREHALALFNFWLKWVLREAGLALSDAHGQSRTLYCLRHTAITFRLLYGQGIDMLTLARNARTSVDMIEKFYASTLTGEMNVGMLQSRRAQKKPRGGPGA
jgi:integrase